MRIGTKAGFTKSTEAKVVRNWCHMTILGLFFPFMTSVLLPFLSFHTLLNKYRDQTEVIKYSKTLVISQPVPQANQIQMRKLNIQHALHFHCNYMILFLGFGWIIFFFKTTKTSPDLEFQIDLINNNPFSCLFACKNPGEMSKESLMVDHK